MSVNATARERAGQAEGAPDPQDVELAWDVVRVRRDGAGPPLLWLHGSHLADLWLPFHRRLAGSLDVIAPTHPGFREGRPPAWLGGFDDLALFYRGLLDALGLGRVHVGGHALGGWLAAELAVLAPDRVASLSLVAPMGLRVPGAPVADFLAASPDRLAQLVFSELAGDQANLLGDPADPDDFSRLYGEHGVSARLMWERRYDLRLERRLPLVTVPALVLAPRDDRLVPAAHADRWAELLPAGRVHAVPGPHAAIVTSPGTFADLIAGHVQEAAS
jgi:pimeloyl-ACP methyl ester carboxylesterase